jgi:hypothetical protein
VAELIPAQWFNQCFCNETLSQGDSRLVLTTVKLLDKSFRIILVSNPIRRHRVQRELELELYCLGGKSSLPKHSRYLKGKFLTMKEGKSWAAQILKI